jgi:hypothetical protein
MLADNRRRKVTFASSPQTLTFLILSFMTIILLVQINYDFSKVSTYLWYCACVAIFRSLIYTFNREQVTIVKLKKEFHADKNLREVAGLYIETSHWFQLFRSTIYLWGAWFLEEYPAIQIQLAYISFAFDVQILYRFLNVYVFSSKFNVISHSNPTPPGLIQLSLVIAGMFWFLHS